ncbi:MULTISPECIES: acetyl-CoA C-acetyltransferase [Henriciella]|mgnify:FL=1|uniref:Acetyl-CoA C-acetyltransferase n=1 Tax=Henriciella mobilis TaxID=2305467 RepID=A0A399RAF9_9PROT|nr:MULTISPECIES: acetyl-CoA C-acetyltransferase [Henriciella]RIJ16542.1 acetyl-CoA C-acetyltransferase [Henriciella mobilis]RIJ20032.1 acetyl-CoA C-acetyltransferase [Henriciella mobilis]RIJ26509.1 acetyl-CoA C-acetyltransferase [Henriciella mobilis]
MPSHDPVICAPVRTAIGAFGGSLKNVPASDLGAIAIKAALERAGLAPDRVDTVIMGQVLQAGAGMNPARQAAIGAGLPVNVPAMTVNRVCGSGAQAVITAAQDVMLGHAACAVAGGMENMDQAPFLLGKARYGYRLGDGALIDSLLRDGLNDAFSGEHSGWHTEDLAEQNQISRAAQDAWALRSQSRFSKAQSDGLFDAEIVPVEMKTRKGISVFDRDEHNRPDTTLDSLAHLKPAFREHGTITAGNAPGLNAGAAAMIVADRAWAETNQLQPAVRIAGMGVGAVEPGLFGLGPVPAVKQALERAAWPLASVERVEINEAFAAIAVALVGELGFSEDIVNVEGGAIAHGHPIGATGAVLSVRLIHAMQRDNLKRGIVTLCIGGGQGVALALERIPS